MEQKNIISTGIFVLIAVAFLTVMVTQIKSTRYLDCTEDAYPTYNTSLDVCLNTSNLACMNSTLYVYNTTYGVCYNGTDIEVNTSRQVNTTDNVARAYTGLSATEYTVIGIIIVVIIVAIGYFVLSSLGVIGATK